MSNPEEPGEKGFQVEDRRGVARDEAGGAVDESAGPAIDFATFIMSLGSSVLIHLGEMSAPGEPGETNLPIARQTIDLLGMLSEKTRGNLTDDEAKLLQHLLYDLRLKYVEARQRG